MTTTLEDLRALSERATETLRNAPDNSWCPNGDADAVLELYDSGLVELMKLGFWDRYVFRRSARGRKALRVLINGVEP